MGEWVSATVLRHLVVPTPLLTTSVPTLTLLTKGRSLEVKLVKVKIPIIVRRRRRPRSLARTPLTVDVKLPPPPPVKNPHLRLDGYEVIATVGTDAGNSVLSESITLRLRMVTTKWDRPKLSAWGHLITPHGRFAGSVDIVEHRYMANFFVLSVCAPGVIVDMDFLPGKNANSDLHQRMISLKSLFSEPYKGGAEKKPVRLARNHVTLPPRLVMLLPRKADVSAGIEEVSDGKVNLLL